ncbi:MAG: hypothetical protein FJ128_07155 [Deltaproteobacteria bacterium]|nr:hypothetical protein [Deltaproteobacteria bacterium]
MKVVFILFLRLFGSLVAARLFLLAAGWSGRDWLIGLTLALTANLYLFDFLEWRGRWVVRRRRENLDASPPAPGGEERATR